jgi:hypothetical protein
LLLTQSWCDITFGVATAATIDLLRRDLPWHGTFWAPMMGIILVLGFVFPAGITWGAHLGGIVAGGLVGAVACDPRHPTERRRLVVAVTLAALMVVATLAAVPVAARHTVNHGPVLVGAPASREAR